MDNAYDFQNIERDLSDALDMIVQAEPTLISLLPSDGPPAMALKHEWGQDRMVPEDDSLNGAIVDAVATTWTVANGAAFISDMVVAIEGSDEVVLVTAVSGDDLTVQRGYGGSTAEAQADGTVLHIVSRPRPDGTDAGDDPGQAPSTDFNHTEIFDFTAKVGLQAQAVAQYGIANQLDYRVQHGLSIVTRRMNRSIIYGRRVAAADGVNGSMGGFLQFVKQPGGVAVDAAGAALSPALLNDTIETIVKRGGRPTVLWCNTNQARKITGFNVANLQVDRGDQQTGNAVYRFVNDLPMGIITTIVVDQNFPKDKIGMPDTTRMRRVALNNHQMTDMDATQNGAAYVARRLYGSYTLEVRNALDAHGLIENLAL